MKHITGIMRVAFPLYTYTIFQIFSYLIPDENYSFLYL